jgi:hypothetical protein
MLADALQQLEGITAQRRGGITAEKAADAVRFSIAARRAADAAAAAPGLRSCGLASCGAREAHPNHFKSCAACRIPVYCCKEHQTEHWPDHKAACKAARKGKAAAQPDV